MVSFPQVSPPKPCIRLSSPPYVLHAPHISFFSILSPEQYWVSTIINLLIMYFSSLPCHLFPLRFKYSPQHLILKHPQPIFLPQSEQPSFTPVQNNRQNYSSLYRHGILIEFIAMPFISENNYIRQSTQNLMYFTSIYMCICTYI